MANATAKGADGADIGAVELGAREAKRRCAGARAKIIANRRPTRGTPGRDVIYAGPEPGLIRARARNDVVCAGGGREALIGGGGEDELFGGPGRDRLLGGPGLDLFSGGPGEDRERR